jgi:hypothetical protein
MIPKAAMRATNNAMRGYIPHNGIVSAGAKIVAGQQKQGKKPGTGREKQKRPQLTEINHNGKAVLKGKTTVAAAVKKLHDYEETGLLPYEVRSLIERAHNLEKRVEKLEGWENDGS